MSLVAGRGHLEKCRVLLVEPHEESGEVVVEVLSEEGAEVAHVASGADAIEWLAAKSPTVIVSELILPEPAGGYALAELVRSSRALAKTPLIALTCDGRASSRQRAESAGFDVVMVKPSMLEDLVAAIARLDERRAP